MNIHPQLLRRLAAALVALWYLLVYTHLASFALAQAEVAGGQRTCCCIGTGHADACALPDEDLGCHSPRPTSCLFAAPCGGELPAAPQTDTLTWPHLAATASSLQPLLASGGLGLPQLSPAFSHLPPPPDKVPKRRA
ncbi:MAG: hypothetical protein FJY95_17465 [Candidatus Handelsmanbacteria bacterium]|nr:hypothetical protein [Candidatus Handelsmanbacteria bacterium]